MCSQEGEGDTVHAPNPWDLLALFLWSKEMVQSDSALLQGPEWPPWDSVSLCKMRRWDEKLSRVSSISTTV